MYSGISHLSGSCTGRQQNNQSDYLNEVLRNTKNRVISFARSRYCFSGHEQASYPHGPACSPTKRITHSWMRAITFFGAAFFYLATDAKPTLFFGS